MTILEFEFGTPIYDESIRLRDDILRAPLGLDFSPADLEGEYAMYHLGAFQADGKMVGCLIMQPLSDEVFHMRQVAVAEDQQGQGIGTAMVLASEELTSKYGGEKIVLHARIAAVPFYKKLAYEVIGEQFEEVGIAHFKMEKIVNKSYQALIPNSSR